MLKLEKSAMQWRYYILLAILTVAYSVVAFTNLGNTQVPKDYLNYHLGDSFVITLPKEVEISKVNVYNGATVTRYRTEISNDGVNWTDPTDFNKGYVFQWNERLIGKNARFIKLNILSTEGKAYLYELAVFEKGSEKPLPLVSVTDKSGNDIKALYDEQQLAVFTPTFMSGTYFDELYYTDSAFEYLNRLEPTETTHPPLGKYIIALGTMIFGYTPFGFRFMGTLFGIFIIPALFWLTQVLFKNPRYSLIAATLIALDFMHFTQTRITAIDSFPVFFIIMMYIYIYKYYQLSFYKTDLKTTLMPLFWCGVFFGLGSATKWISIYAVIGVYLLFLLSIISRYREYIEAVNYKPTNKINKATPTATPTDHIKQVFPSYFKTTVICGVVFLGVIPFIIYFLTYIPFMFIIGHPYTIGELFNYQQNMFLYHSQLEKTNPYSSSWFTWPFIYKPMWIYSGPTAGAGNISTIATFGNPAIWWAGILAFCVSIPLAIKNSDKRLQLIIIGYLSQFLPWMFITRMVFIYHYFASVPFVILLLVFVIYYMEKRFPKFRYITYAYLGLAAILFAMFYPVISGAEVSRDYVQIFLKWFDSWRFYY